MMLAALGLAAGLALTQERPAVKEVLPNGATIYVQQVKGARKFSLVLASVPAGEPEPPESHGLRHLLEHLLARGGTKAVDATVEAKGMVMLAETTRDAMTFQVTGSSDDLSVGLKAMKDVLVAAEPSSDDVKRETEIIRQELALRPWDILLTSDGWLRAYGERAVDPFGDPEKLSQTSLETVIAAMHRLFEPRALCATLVGDFEAEPKAAVLRDLLGKLPQGKEEADWSRSSAARAVLVGSSDGEAVSMPVGAFPESTTLASLAAAFGLRVWVPGCRVLFNPSPRAGTVTLALRSGSSWADYAHRIEGKENVVAQSGLGVLRAWLKEVATDPPRLAKVAAVMLPLDPSFDPLSITSMADAVQQDEVSGQIRAMLLAAGGTN